MTHDQHARLDEGRVSSVELNNQRLSLDTVMHLNLTCMAGRPDWVNRNDLGSSAIGPVYRELGDDVLHEAKVDLTTLRDRLGVLCRPSGHAFASGSMDAKWSSMLTATEESSTLGTDRLVLDGRVLAEEDVHGLDGNKLEDVSASHARGYE